MNPTKSVDVIVVGGGLMGSSTAYQLSKYGVSTLLVEQGQLASGASGANFGNVQVQDADFGFSLELTIQGAQRCAELETELDFDLGYRKTGSLLLIENDHQQSLLSERIAHLLDAGLRAELLDKAQLIELGTKGISIDKKLSMLTRTARQQQYQECGTKTAFQIEPSHIEYQDQIATRVWGRAWA